MATLPITIRPMTAQDWPEVRAIYEQGIAAGNATFEISAPEWVEWDAAHLHHSRIVAVDGDGIAGWAALSRVSNRAVYAGVAEVSVYVAAQRRGRGIGRCLLHELVLSSEQNGIWTLQASIFPENPASLAIHLRDGFRLVGRREKLAQLSGVWRDVLLLERRKSETDLLTADR